MSMRLNPYLAFDGNARQAMAFYHSVFGGTLTVSTFGEYQMSDNPADDERVMHAVLEAPGHLTLMGADLASGDGLEASNLAVSLNGDDARALRKCWDKLAKGATVLMPLEKAPWGDSFGMLVDRFGTRWLVNITN